MLLKILGINDIKGDDEAVLLFTSGSSGEPKGVPLTHRNVLANVCQFGCRIHLSHEAKILGCLPLFHSFGSTVTLWYPCIEGINLVTYPNPLETKRLAELISMHSANMLLSTPTFLRGYMRRVKPDQLQSLDYLITRAEKLSKSLAEAFKETANYFPASPSKSPIRPLANHAHLTLKAPSGSRGPMSFLATSITQKKLMKSFKKAG